jgi:4-hydroxythreonine-4-phosphate dehydrogenase
MKPVIAITMGDANGIGPEVTLKSILSPSIHTICSPVIVGSLDVYGFYAERLRLKISFKEIETIHQRLSSRIIPVLETNKYHRPIIRPGRLSSLAGRFAGSAIEKAAELCRERLVDGIVTAPVSKEALHLSGYHYPGQTEMLTDLFDAHDATMMLIAKNFRVGLVTIHTPLRRVSSQLCRRTIHLKLRTLSQSLKNDFTIPSPKIAVLGLNPHAGENGVIGNEELKHIVPAIRSARRIGIRVDGPFAADGFLEHTRMKASMQFSRCITIKD